MKIRVFKIKINEEFKPVSQFKKLYYIFNIKKLINFQLSLS
jgi:hypothetical protein